VGGCGGNRVGLVSLAALAALAWAVSADDAWLYRGGFLLAALAAAGLVAWLAFGLPSAVHRAFAHPTTVWMGKRSYALYVWHWPVVVALTPEVAGFGGARLGMVQAALAVALAAASYRLVEEPVRIGLPARRGLLATGAVSGAAAVLAVGLLASGTALPAARPGAVLSLEAAAASPAPAPSAQPSPAPRAEPAKPPPLRVLLLGDSQAYVVADDTARWALAPGVDLSAWATIGCGIGSAPVVSAGVQLPYPGAACDEWAEAWRDKATVARPDVVVVQLGAWEVTDVLVAGQVLAFGTPEHDAWLLERLRMAFAAAGASGAPVVALDVPCYAARPGAFTVAAERNDPARVAHLNALVAQVAAEHGAVVAAQDHFACEGDVERRLPTGAELRYDGVHYTRDGVAAFWAWLTPLLHDVAGRTDQRRPAVAAQ
jgi:hypothetical protein